MNASKSNSPRRSPIAHIAPKSYNRISEILKLLAARGLTTEAQLADMCGMSRSELNRVRRGLCTPSFAVMAAITKVLERYCGRRIDPRDILNFDGNFPTASLHVLLGFEPEDN